MNECSKESSNIQMENNNGSSTPASLEHTCIESSELQHRRKGSLNKRNEFQFMESISTQSGEDDFLKRTVDDSAANTDKSVYLDSSKSVSSNEFKLGECKYLDPKDDFISSQFGLNLNLLKKLNLSSNKVSVSSLKSEGTAKCDGASYQPQKNVHLKKTKELLPSNGYTLQESEYTTKSDQLTSETGRFCHYKEHSITGKDSFNRSRDNLSAGKQLLSSRSNESRDGYKSGDYSKKAQESNKHCETGKPQVDSYKSFHLHLFKSSNPSEEFGPTPSTHVDKSSSLSQFVVSNSLNSPKRTHKTLKDVKLTSLRDYKHTLHYFQNSQKYTPQSLKNSQYDPKESELTLNYAKLTSLKESGYNMKDSQKLTRQTHQSFLREKSKDLPGSANDSNLSSLRMAQKPFRDDRKICNDAVVYQPVDSSYLRNPAARVRNVQFWFKPFSTSKSSSLNSYNGLQVIESLTGNVQKSWHLEAIKGLDRNNYGELKMTMLRLTNSRFNIHPNRLLIRCRGSWDVIQEGSFGTVYLGFVEGFGSSAVKVPNAAMLNYDSVGVMKRFINEWDILTRCSHRNIVGIYGGIILGLFDIWLCTELVNGVDLHTVKYGSSHSFGNHIHQMFSNNASLNHYLYGSGPNVFNSVNALNGSAQTLLSSGLNNGNASSKNSHQLLGGGSSVITKNAYDVPKNSQQFLGSVNPSKFPNGIVGKSVITNLGLGNDNQHLPGVVNPSSSNTHAHSGNYKLYSGVGGTLLTNNPVANLKSINTTNNSVTNLKSINTTNNTVANLKSIGGADSFSGADRLRHSSRSPRIIPPNAALKMCHQLADVLVYLHTPSSSKGVVVHRDIKPENIIVDSDWNIKLCDFGDAFESSTGHITSVSGATWLYAPPELLLHPSIRSEFLSLRNSHLLGSSVGSSHKSDDSFVLSEKWDIWSFGCVIQEMFGYTGPFHHIVSMNDPPHVVCEKMVTAASAGLVPNIPSQLAKTRMGSLILQCLDPVPDNRPSAADIRLILQNADILSP